MYQTSVFIWITYLICVTLQASSNTKINTPVYFNLKDSSINSNKQWTKIRIAVAGGTPPYQYYFDQYPQNWKITKQDIYIPKESLLQNKKYPCKIRVLDQNKNQARASIVYTIKNGKVFISSFINPYDRIYDEKFFNSDDCRGKPQLIRGSSFYSYGNDIDLSNYDEYMPKEQLIGYKKKVQQLNSQPISSQYGVGFNKVFTQADINNAFTNKGTFSLINLFSKYKVTNLNQTNLNVDTKSTIAPSYLSFSLPNIKATQTNIPPSGNIVFGFPNFLNQISTTISKSLQQIDLQKFEFLPNVIPKISQDKKNTQISISVTQPPNSSKIGVNIKSFIPSSPELPTSQQIDDMILAVDSSGFNKLIENINKTTIYTCQQKVQYLNNLLGRVKSAISMKNFAADQLQTLIDNATLQYNSLITQISKKNQEIQNINLTSLRQKLQTDLTTLQGLYSQYNNLDGNISGLDLAKAGLKNEISVLKSKSDIDRQQLIRQKLAYNEADSLVQIIEQKLKEAKTRKQLLQTSLTNYTNFLNNSESQIKKNQANIVSTSQQINKLQKKSDSLKVAYQNIQITVFRYRADIANSSKVQDQYKADISTLEQKIKMQEGKIAVDELNRLKQMIGTLGRSVPTIQNYLDNNYYSCYSIESMIANKTGDSIVYIINLGDFQKYIEAAYILKPDWAKINLPPGTVQLTTLNLLDSTWQAAFGYPYTTLSFAATIDFSFLDDFNCLNPSNLISGFGTITKIQQKYIKITNTEGRQINLVLSPCTRLESTQFIPSTGQRIFWRGVPGIKTGQFNIYKASCV